MRNRGLTLATLTTIATLCALAGGMFLTSASALAAPIVPTVTIKAPTGPTSTTVHVSGTVNPNGSLTATSWSFQYAKDPETEGWTQSVSGAVLGDEEVTGTLEELQPNATYQVRLVATNEEGGEGISPEPNPTFKTLASAPTVIYPGASQINSTEATLEATVNPNNQATSARLQYTTSPTVTGNGSLVGATETSPTALGEEYGERTDGPVTLTGLAPGTAYYYQALATNATGTTYGAVKSFTTVPAPFTDPVTDITATNATLHGHLTLNSVDTHYLFVYRPGTECEVSHTQGSQTDETDAGSGNGSASATSAMTGLQPNTQYAVCLETSNAYGTQTGAVVTFTTSVSAPAVDLQSASEVSPVGATLNAQIEAYGLPTTYHFQYLTADQFQSSGFENPTSVPVAEAELGDAHVDVGVAATLTGLQSETEYHYRVVTTNSAGTTDGPDQTFRTIVSSGALPDGRVEEMVTPVENHDANIYDPNLGIEGNGIFDLGTYLPFQAARNGDAITYAGDPTPGGTGAAGGGSLGNEFLATRTASGWTQQNISPHGHPKAVYEAFSPGLSGAVLRAGGNYLEPSSLLEEAPSGYQVLYTRNNAGGEEHALFTSFEGTPPAKETVSDRFAGGSESFETVLFEASAPLTAGAPAGNDLYEETGGKLSLVNISPEGAAEPEASFGAPDVTGEAGAPDYSHDISEDGGRVFWTGRSSHGLYMHEDGAATLQIDSSQAGGPGGGGQFWTASSDGSRVFLTGPRW